MLFRSGDAKAAFDAYGRAIAIDPSVKDQALITRISKALQPGS